MECRAAVSAPAPELAYSTYKMDLTIIYYTITVFTALLLSYRVLQFLRYLGRRFTHSCPRLHHAFRYLLNSLLLDVLYKLTSLLLSMIPGTDRFARNVQYPLVIPRRYWMSITRLEFAFLALYLGANVTVLIFERARIESAAATLTIINAILLFLGARTNPLADLIGVPLSTYYTFHHFIGRVVVVEGIIHAALAFRRSRPDQTTISGYSVSQMRSLQCKADKHRLLGYLLPCYSLLSTAYAGAWPEPLERYISCSRSPYLARPAGTSSTKRAGGPRSFFYFPGVCGS